MILVIIILILSCFLWAVSCLHEFAVLLSLLEPTFFPPSTCRNVSSRPSTRIPSSWPSFLAILEGPAHCPVPWLDAASALPSALLSLCSPLNQNNAPLPSPLFQRFTWTLKQNGWCPSKSVKVAGQNSPFQFCF